MYDLTLWSCVSEAVAEQGSGPNQSPTVSQNRSSSESPAHMEGKTMRLSDYSSVPVPRVPVRVRNG